MIGREQDCLGGCFESNREAAGPISRFAWHRQDFFGLIDEMRIWKTVRTQEEIKQVILDEPFWKLIATAFVLPTAIQGHNPSPRIIALDLEKRFKRLIGVSERLEQPLKQEEVGKTEREKSSFFKVTNRRLSLTTYCRV